jgi:hypothetical protein
VVRQTFKLACWGCTLRVLTPQTYSFQIMVKTLFGYM